MPRISRKAQEQNYAPNRHVAEVDFTTFINSNQNFEEEIAQVRIEEKNIDIFNIGNEFALAHCISVDGKLGTGTAKSFGTIFFHLEKKSRRAGPKQEESSLQKGMAE
ncbi:hypothetical protein JTB14_004597 [Gonioctena quinquepunctata]|nr:hypothetical protein JTB14_004597 [Gonioctena quinquepunctata]